MNRQRFPVFAVAFALLAFAPAAQASLITYRAALTAEPPAVSSGTGSVVLSYDPATFALRIQTTFSNLTTGVTVAHIHCCTSSAYTGTAGVAIVTPSLTDFPTGVTSGSYDRTFFLDQASSFGSAFVTANGGTVAGARSALLAALDGGRAYLNIHTSRFTGGEIRGFPVPEPGTFALLALGLLGATAVRRRSRAAA